MIVSIDRVHAQLLVDISVCTLNHDCSPDLPFIKTSDGMVEWQYKEGNRYKKRSQGMKSFAKNLTKQSEKRLAKSCSEEDVGECSTSLVKPLQLSALGRLAGDGTAMDFGQRIRRMCVSKMMCIV